MLRRVDRIDYEAGVPPYRQLAGFLRARIESGTITRRLPSEKQLMGEFGLALGTVRKAIGVLRDEGIVHTVPGWGSYVVDKENPPAG
jgi:GntR family transcriptional regulator